MQNLIHKLKAIEKIQQYDIWLADLNPARGPIPGKIRPVVIIQSNLFNNYIDTTIVCPITSNIVEDINYLRVALIKEQVDKKSDILLDQLRTIENRKLIKKLSRLNFNQIKKMKRNLQIVLDL
jgi:mRNA interferase MazF